MRLLVLASAISWGIVLCWAIIAVFFISNDNDRKCPRIHIRRSHSGWLAFYLPQDKVNSCGITKRLEVFMRKAEEHWNDWKSKIPITVKLFSQFSMVFNTLVIIKLCLARWMSHCLGIKKIWVSAIYCIYIYIYCLGLWNEPVAFISNLNLYLYIRDNNTFIR